MTTTGTRGGAARADSANASRPARAVDQPTAAIREQLLDALAKREPVRIAGAGTWLDAGRPVAARRTIAVAAAAGILDYVPGDLTLTARAGTSLADLETATAREGQWLPLDPFGDPAGTIGATVATASAGPLAHAHGTPRDVVLGLECVAGNGDVIRGGGRVVKNVAGFDLTRLITGSWGTLGVITEVSVRLRARPEVDRTVALPLEPPGDALGTQLAGLRRAKLAPMAMEAISAPLAERLALASGGHGTILIRLGGNGDAVGAQRDGLAASGDVVDVDDGIWQSLRRIEPAGASVFRFSAPPAALDTLWTSVLDSLAGIEGVLMHATVGRGIVRCIIPAPIREQLRERLAPGEVPAMRIFERLPASLWSEVAPSAAADRLSSGVRQAFDPAHILNPGILGEPTDGP